MVVSTKRLARTVIEGGRAGYNKYDRRLSNRTQRMRDKRLCRRLCVDPELADGAAEAKRRHVYKGFRDKLAPAERWLASHEGREWLEVEGRILSRFDTRTIAGRHIVFDHLLPRDYWSVWTGWRVSRRWWFHVDDEGLLRVSREPPDRRYRYRRGPRPAQAHPSPRALEFVGERCVGLRGHRAYWLVPTRHFEALTPRSLSEWLEWRRSHLEAGPRRQGHELTPEDRARYDALSAAERLAITVVFPT